MSDHTVPGLRAALKALQEVVTPAVDSSNPLAVEQLRMVCAFLAMLCEQLPHRAQRIRFDMLSAVALGQGVTVAIGDLALEGAAALEDALVRAVAVEGSADTTEAELQQATVELAAATTSVIRASAHAGDAQRDRIERVVLQHAKAWIDVQRAWFAPLGFDKEARSLAPLPALLGDPRSSPTNFNEGATA